MIGEPIDFAPLAAHAKTLGVELSVDQLATEYGMVSTGLVSMMLLHAHDALRFNGMYNAGHTLVHLSPFVDAHQAKLIAEIVCATHTEAVVGCRPLTARALWILKRSCLVTVDALSRDSVKAQRAASLVVILYVELFDAVMLAAKWAKDVLNERAVSMITTLNSASEVSVDEPIQAKE
jgi:hypothetical protein